jgi:imidazolonepropionase-like amidohydrolase
MTTEVSPDSTADGPAREDWILPPRLLPPDAAPRFVHDGLITTAPPPAARALPGRFALPGLVDAHAHVALGDDVELGMADALTMLRASRDQGVLLLREMGSPHGLVFDIPKDPTLPRLLVSGEQIVRESYFPGLTPVEPGALVRTALQRIEQGAHWIKIVADFLEPVLVYDAAEMRELADVVHRNGARLAAHCLHSDFRALVDVGVDSIEHGYLLDETVLRVMADRGIAWVPTTGAVIKPIEKMQGALLDDATPADRRERIDRWLPTPLGWRESTRRMLPVAWELGVTVLPSTDREESVADEVERFIAYGLDPTRALASATTEARAFLGGRGIEPGAPADVVTVDSDPTVDPSALRRPVAILMDGVRVK